MPKRVYTDDHKKFVINNAYGNNSIKLTAMLNKHFGTDFEVHQINILRYSLGAISGIDTKISKTNDIGKHSRFKKGSKIGIEHRIKKGQRIGIATEFKKGQTPMNWCPVGSERVRNPDGYVWIKIAEPNKWINKHRLIWIEKYGQIPKDKKLVFLDGNKLNCTLENLALVDYAQMLVINNKRLITPDSELTKAGILLSKLILKTSIKSKKMDQERVGEHAR